MRPRNPKSYRDTSRVSGACWRGWIRRQDDQVVLGQSLMPNSQRGHSGHSKQELARLGVAAGREGEIWTWWSRRWRRRCGRCQATHRRPRAAERHRLVQPGAAR